MVPLGKFVWEEVINMTVTVFVDNLNFDRALKGINFDGSLVPYETNQIAVQVPLYVVRAQTFHHTVEGQVTYVHCVL